MKKSLAIICGCLAAFVTSSVSADVIVDADYTAAQGYVDGNLQFQNGWLGQAGTVVSDSAGTGVLTGGAWLRNVNSAGALGNTIADAPAAGPGFAAGDMLQITFDYSVDLGTLENQNLANFGVRSEFGAATGFNSVPEQGVQMDYNLFDQANGGSIKFFGNGYTTGKGDNADALIIDGVDLGLDTVNGDLVTDNLQIVWKVTSDGAGNFDLTDLTVTNLDSAFSASYTGAAQSFAWTAGDAFVAQQLLPDNTANHVASSDGILYEFFPAAVPEPTAVTLLATLGMGLFIRRKRS